MGTSPVLSVGWKNAFLRVFTVRRYTRPSIITKPVRRRHHLCFLCCVHRETSVNRVYWTMNKIGKPCPIRVQWTCFKTPRRSWAGYGRNGKARLNASRTDVRLFHFVARERNGSACRNRRFFSFFISTTIRFGRVWVLNRVIVLNVCLSEKKNNLQ